MLRAFTGESLPSFRVVSSIITVNTPIIPRAISPQLRKSMLQSVWMPVTVLNILPSTFSSGTESISPITVPIRSAMMYCSIYAALICHTVNPWDFSIPRSTYCISMVEFMLLSIISTTTTASSPTKM